MVEIDEEQSIVCVVGDFMAERPGLVRHIFNALKDIPVRMISYGGSMNNVSLLLHSQDKEKALRALHHHLFLNREVHVN
jgi:aspartate kinase